MKVNGFDGGAMTAEEEAETIHSAKITSAHEFELAVLIANFLETHKNGEFGYARLHVQHNCNTEDGTFEVWVSLLPHDVYASMRDSGLTEEEVTEILREPTNRRALLQNILQRVQDRHAQGDC